MTAGLVAATVVSLVVILVVGVHASRLRRLRRRGNLVRETGELVPPDPTELRALPAPGAGADVRGAPQVPYARVIRPSGKPARSFFRRFLDGLRFPGSSYEVLSAALNVILVLLGVLTILLGFLTYAEATDDGDDTNEVVDPPTDSTSTTTTSTASPTSTSSTRSSTTTSTTSTPTTDVTPTSAPPVATAETLEYADLSGELGAVELLGELATPTGNLATSWTHYDELAFEGAERAAWAFDSYSTSQVVQLRLNIFDLDRVSLSAGISDRSAGNEPIGVRVLADEDQELFTGSVDLDHPLHMTIATHGARLLYIVADIPPGPEFVVANAFGASDE